MCLASPTSWRMQEDCWQTSSLRKVPSPQCKRSTQVETQKWVGQWCRNERYEVCTMNPEGRDCHVVDETSNPAGASPNSPAYAARSGTGRMHSWMQSPKGNRKGLTPCILHLFCITYAHYDHWCEHTSYGSPVAIEHKSVIIYSPFIWKQTNKKPTRHIS